MQPQLFQLKLKTFPLLRPSRTSIHFLQESVRVHFQDLGRQCIIPPGILEDLGRKCLVLQDFARNV